MAVAAIAKFVLLVSTRFLMVSADQSEGNALSDPLGKVNELLSTLKSKILQEGEAEAKAYEEFVRWCHKASENLNYEIKNYEQIKEKQEAKVAEFASNIQVADSKIEKLAGAISQDQAELNDAIAMRGKQQKDFAATEKELTEATDALSRATSIISTEMAKNPAALAQIDKSSISSLLLSLGNVVDAAGLASADRTKLIEFVQSREASEDQVGAPAAATYASQSGNIVDLLEDLHDKAQGELAEARKVEAGSKHNFNLMRQSLEDEMAATTKDLYAEKSAKANAEDEKAKVEGDLATTVPDLEDDKKSLHTFGSDCMQSASDHDATMAARNEEVKVLTHALQILKEEASGAGEISRAIFSKYSFLQTASMTKSTMRSRTDLANAEAAAMVKKLAREQHSATLAQLASRISVVQKYGAKDGANPFDKIKGLVSQMLAKLEKEAEAEATENSWCVEQTSKTEDKKEDLEHDHAKLVTSIDQAVARKVELKEDITELFKEVSLLSSTIAELSSIRSEEHANYLNAKADLEGGMAGVGKVKDILMKHYGNSAALIQDSSQSRAFLQQPSPPEHYEKSSKAGGPIIDILEVVEADFAATLTKEEAQESDAEEQFQTIFTEKRDCKITKEKDLQYKKPELIALEKQISELGNDKQGMDSELSAVLQYYAQVQARCVAKPHSYESGKARIEAEINGLKEVLSTLESETSLVQRKRRMRGAAAALQ